MIVEENQGSIREKCQFQKTSIIHYGLRAQVAAYRGFDEESESEVEKQI